MMRKIHLLILLALLCAAGPASRKQSLELPTLKIAWTWPRDARQVLIQGDTLYAADDQSVTAVRAADGHVTWTTEIAPDKMGTNGILLTDDVIAAAVNGSVVLLNARTGTILHTVELGGTVINLFGPPLLAEVSHDDSSEFIRIDDASGSILARKTTPAFLYTQQEGDTLVGIPDSSESEPSRIMGLNVKDLSERWTILEPAYTTPTTIRGHLYLTRSPEDQDADGTFLPLDAGTGKVGTPLPGRSPSRLWASRDEWEFQYVGDRPDGGSTVRRNNFETGKVVWQANLPGRPQASLLDGNKLYLHCGSEQGRGVFFVLDWKSGKILQQAYGLHSVSQFLLYKNILIASTYRDGLVAFSTDELAPPMAQQNRVELEVLRILTGEKLTTDCWWQDTDTAVSDLQDLGPGALPIILRQLPNLSAPAVDVAARIFEKSHYTEAAPALAARLPDLHPCSELGWARNNPVLAVLRALAVIGGAGEMPAIKQIMLDPEQQTEARREAFSTLVSLGDSKTTDILDSALDAVTPKAHAWFIPPDPGKYLDRLGTTVTREELLNIDEHDIEKWLWLERAQGSKRLRYQGKDVFLFPCENVGGQADLWMIVRDSSGKTSSARFLGVSAHGQMIVRDDVRYKAAIQDNRLILTLPDGSTRNVDLDSLDVDSDHDGLPDLLEVRMHTDPHQADSDDDGEPDGLDLSPNSGGKPANEQQEITAAIFQQYFAFAPQEHPQPVSLAIVVSDFALNWQGWNGPVITLTQAEDKAFLKEAGYDGVPHISIAPADAPGNNPDIAAYTSGPAPAIALKPGERLYTLTIYRGGLNASGHLIVLRKISGKWYVRQTELTWVS